MAAAPAMTPDKSASALALLPFIFQFPAINGWRITELHKVSQRS
jgi:hypothetical protein